MKPGLALEARLGASACRVDVALREEDRLGGLAVLRAQGAAVDQLGRRLPVAFPAHCMGTFRHKKTGREKQPAGHFHNPAL
jgi:hypothetical protein